jgi:RND superfamily putative drug exporter
VRAVLLPASMKLLGRWNWYLPGWLGWLPGARPGRSQPSARPPLAARTPARAPAGTPS